MVFEIQKVIKNSPKMSPKVMKLSTKSEAKLCIFSESLMTHNTGEFASNLAPWGASPEA